VRTDFIYTAAKAEWARNSNLCVREADWKKRRSFALKVGSLLVRRHKRDSQQPRPASSAFGSAGSKIISIPICRREKKTALSSLSLSQPIHPSRPSTKDAVFFACCLFSPRIFHITISSGSRQPHLICHYGRRRIQRDPFEPLGGEAPESKDARKLPAVAFRPFISLSLSLCGESGATHTDKRLLLIICLCECTFLALCPFTPLAVVCA